MWVGAGPSMPHAALAEVQRQLVDKRVDSLPAGLSSRNCGGKCQVARVYALQTIAQHDATLACWDSKYTYLELRPPQADPTIIPVFAIPQHPGYPSGHACASGASAAVMSYLFPADATALTGMATDAGNSTFDALIHTQLDVSTGATLGGQVGQQVVAHAQTDGAN